MAKIAYATKVENGGTTAAGRFSAADGNEVKTSVNALYDLEPYTVFRALINQSGTADPVITVLQNNTGKTFTASRVGTGRYAITPNTGYTAAKTFLRVGQNQSSGVTYLIVCENYNGTDFAIRSRDIPGNTAVDSALLNTSFELYIYP